MAIPHDIQKRMIKKRLIGLEGKARLSEIKKILGELPGYNTGPYGEIRKSLMDEIGRTKTRSKVKHQDWLGVPRHGHKQFCLVGAPSAGKSSLLALLSGMDIKTAAYEFTTLKPIPAVVKLNGAQIQIVDLPGLIEGATEDVGGGKRLIGIVKNTGGILFMIDAASDFSKAEKVYQELAKADIDKPIIFVANKIDMPAAQKAVQTLKNRYGKISCISTITGEGLEELKLEIWKCSNLMRVYTEDTDEPVILERNSTIKDFIERIHKKLLETCSGALITGPSAKFPNQKVGLNHVLKDTDRVRIVSK